MNAKELLFSINKADLCDEELQEFLYLLEMEENKKTAEEALLYLCKVKIITREQIDILSNSHVIKQSLSFQRILNLTIREREYREVAIKFKQEEESESVWKTLLSIFFPWTR